MAQILQFVRGDTSEAKFKSIEMSLQRIWRRTHKHVVAAITPFPISTFVKTPESDGVVARYFFPLKGRITKIYLAIDKFPKGGVVATIIADYLGTKKHISTVVIKNFFAQDLNFPVDAGTRATVVLAPTNQGLEISDIWTGAAWVPELSSADLKKFVLDELEKEAKGDEDASSDEG